MARERMVTRSINVVEFTVMVVDTNESNTVKNVHVTIPSADNVKDIEAVIKSTLASGLLFVQIVGKESTEVLYGMPEIDFIRFARVLPSRTKVDE